MPCNAQKVGYIVTNTNDTIKTYSIPDPYGWNNHYYYYKLITQLKPKKKTKIYTNDICELKVIDLKLKDTITYLMIEDTVHIKMFIAEPSSKFNFSTLEKRKLVRRDSQLVVYNFWKVLYIKNNLSICNLTWTVNFASSVYDNNEYRGYEALAIISNKNKKTPIYTWEPRSNPKKDIPELSDSLMKFINMRYNLIISPEEFKKYMDSGKDIESQTKLFDFILDKEAELEEKQAGK